MANSLFDFSLGNFSNGKRQTFGMKRNFLSLFNYFVTALVFKPIDLKSNSMLDRLNKVIMDI